MIEEIKVEAGQEVLATLMEELNRRKISRGAIVSLIGAVDSCCISNMPKDDAKKDILTEYNEPLELSGTGEIRDGNPHIHCVLGREGDQTLSGHLHWAKVSTWYVSAYVMRMA
jgi:predicted DNA-binding protein with PD1-like motif